MNLSKRMIPLAAFALAAAALAGCMVAVDPVPVPPPVTAPSASGTFTINWLVAGQTNPSLCSAYGATHLELTVYAASGTVIAREYPLCGSFSATMRLPAGTYTAEVTLVGPSNQAISVTKPLAAIEVVPGTDLAINVDFPSSSML